ncbi:T9SS type A sorting domain-containing protein [Fibrella forsythiae]|uniref:T9SS type A sorting domain-containing protein n=1 Tax=Fibrella forsythiae TaxID=2817061 RepID=A0ABS3JNI4_9BACT|nr:T9SS type A sorting domain-containing protein [Fibrella forsythiae]MBO0950462.1 T9SS type A sorting domain-containing protein [Fibrella forsythiae]
MRLISCLLALVLIVPSAFANHFIGGYIRATPLSGLTYQITATLYYNTTEGAAAASELYICFGDNNNSRPVTRTAVQSLSVSQGVGEGISMNEYTTVYTYAGAGVYTVQLTGINRSSTINAGASQQPFSLRTTLLIGGSANHTPTVPFPPASLNLTLNQRASLSLAATDPEGDSLSYSLAFPLMGTESQLVNTALCSQVAVPVRSYQFPNDVRQAGTYRLNAKTGLLTWDVPVAVGQYSVAIIVSEWRSGGLLSQTHLELTMNVFDRGGIPITPPAYEPAQLALITAVSAVDVDDMLLRVSPNPAVGESVRVDLLLERSQSVLLELTDSQGRVYKTVRMEQPALRHQYMFDMVGKPAGLYLIRAESGGKQTIRKLLKQ